MDASNPASFAENAGQIQIDLRHRISTALVARLETITADTVAIFPYSGSEERDGAYRHRVGRLLAQLLAFAVRDGRLDPRGGFVGDLHGVVLERSFSTERLFTFVYLTERTALDELALSETIGATSEPWPVVAQLVRRASFDLLAAFAERAQLEPSSTAIVDRLTTLYTRPLFEAVFAKEVERAGRYGYQISLILFDVDQLAAINRDYGYGVGDSVLERLGILIRQYFRLHDWVARFSEDSIAVLLSQTEADRAAELAERARQTIEERLWFTDHRSDNRVAVTVSAGVVNVQVALGDVIDPERLLADAETNVNRAKREGRNRVERTDGYSGARQSRLSSP
jgi:diguanylate cyclase (GGDEF)-like protein